MVKSMSNPRCMKLFYLHDVVETRVLEGENRVPTESTEDCTYY